ncbi:hypothetical protein [Candidatus Poriferisodalis sp.]|uniref:hypothetical protein n=1 Tax=Candidatus Poriferisodalis sp. TaxID=3101277 RepID=UPI003B519BA0
MAAPATAESYQPATQGRGGKSPPSPGHRQAHGAHLSERLESAFDTAHGQRTSARDIDVEGTIDGIYVEFESFPGYELALQSLEPRNSKVHPELRAVRSITVEDHVVQLATVFVPDQQVDGFLRKFEEYATEDTPGGNPRHQNLVERIADLRLATLEAFWTEPAELFPPPEERTWWELWLRERNGVESRVASFAEQTDVTVGMSRLIFSERRVMLVRATARQLSSAVGVLDDLAEIRHPSVAAQPLADWSLADQREFVHNLADRVRPPAPDSPAICLLDTGIEAGHPLISPAFAPLDAHACNPRWGGARRSSRPWNADGRNRSLRRSRESAALAPTDDAFRVA